MFEDSRFQVVKAATQSACLPILLLDAYGTTMARSDVWKKDGMHLM